MTAEAVNVSPELNLGPQDRIVIIGAGGFAANELYIPPLLKLGVPRDRFVLVDIDKERLAAVHERLEGSEAYLDADQAFEAMAELGQNPYAVFITSSTGAHESNINAVERANLGKTPVWCEKPLVPPKSFHKILELVARRPDLNISVGHILRFSETLSALDEYLTDNNLTVTGLDWVYGKDRRPDKRPTQGVHPDEVMHPVTVTEQVLSRRFGQIIGVEVDFAQIQKRPFADPERQQLAHDNSDGEIPLDPTSDVDADLSYAFSVDGKERKVPVVITCSFLMPVDRRRVTIGVTGPQGPDTLVLDFDTKMSKPDGDSYKADTLRKGDGTLLYEWSGSKAEMQLRKFLGIGSDESSCQDKLATFEVERRVQGVLSKIGEVALWGDALDDTGEVARARRQRKLAILHRPAWWDFIEA